MGYSPSARLIRYAWGRFPLKTPCLSMISFTAGPLFTTIMVWFKILSCTEIISMASFSDERRKRTDTSSPYSAAQRVSLAIEFTSGSQQDSINTHWTKGKVLGTSCTFPSRNLVGGPGGRNRSRWTERSVGGRRCQLLLSSRK